MTKILVYIDQGLLSGVYVQEDGKEEYKVSLIDTDDEAMDPVIVNRRWGVALEVEDIEKQIKAISVIA